MGSVVDYPETSANFVNFTGKFLNFGTVYICYKCRDDYADGGDSARIWGKKLWDSSVGGDCFVSFERGFGETEIDELYYGVLIDRI